MAKNYFQFSHPVFYAIIPTALVINYLAWYDPDLISPVYLGPIGRFAIYIGKNHHQFTVYSNIFAVVAHTLEGLWGVAICSQKGIGGTAKLKWFLQTFLLGFGSLYLLFRYKPDSRKRR